VRRACFQASGHAIDSTVHQACAAWLHSSAAVPLSSELLRARLRPSPFGDGLTARVSALFATSPGASTCAGRPSPASFRPQAFAASRRFSPRAGFEACFILEPRPGFVSRSGASLSAQRLRPRRAALPPCRWTSGALAMSLDKASASGDLGFEVSLRAEKRSHRLGDEPGRWPLPSSGSSPPGSLHLG
jgi:hypothetical protein